MTEHSPRSSLRGVVIPRNKDQTIEIYYAEGESLADYSEQIEMAAKGRPVVLVRETPCTGRFVEQETLPGCKKAVYMVV